MIMREEQLAKLEPFLYRKSARQRVILFLLASGMNITHIKSMKAEDLRKMHLPDMIAFYRDEMLSEAAHKGDIFNYQSGTDMPVSAIYRILRDTTNKVLGKPLSPEAFKRYIQGAHKR